MPYIRCSYCGSDKHTLNLCPKTWGGQGERNALYCGYCGKHDHNQQSCPALGLTEKVPGTYRKD